jgi:hypothetical protein
MAEVREVARPYRARLSGSDLDLVIPYDGSVIALRTQGLSLRHAILVNLVHHH